MRLPTALAAALLAAVPAGPAPPATAADPPAAVSLAAPVPTPAPGATAPAPDPGAVTWGVAPSGPDGPDGRPGFAYKLDPGAVLTDQVAVTNHTPRPLTLDVYASDAFTTAQGGFDLLAADRAPVDVGSWITLPARTVTVPATSRVDIPFELRVPADATPGDHAGGIVASLAAEGTGPDGNRVAVDHRVGTRVHLRVTGQLRPVLAVEDLRIGYDGPAHPFTGGDLTATFTVRNTGNVRLTGPASLTATGPLGLGTWTATTDPLPEILPGGELRTRVRLSGVPPLVRLTATARVAPAAVGDQVLDPPPAAEPARAAVWAWPWPHLLLLAGLGLLALAAVRLRRRRRAVLAEAVARARAQGRAEAAAADADQPADPDTDPDPGGDDRIPAAATGKDRP
ncbi:WxL protein peptidoglycan domain-containing protein [Polymorphospora rubra]|nr:DUF916 domain-containing protein [Polymorphospora rubra]